MNLTDTAAHAALANAQNAQAYVTMTQLGQVSMIASHPTAFSFELMLSGVKVAEASFPYDNEQPTVFEIHGQQRRFAAPTVEMVVAALSQIVEPYRKELGNA